MENKQIQTLKLQQKLTPQQMQIIKMLELPTIEFEQRIKQELVDNPALEVAEKEPEEEIQENTETNDDEFSLEDYLNEGDIPSYKLLTNNYSRDNQEKIIPHASGIDFKQFLKSQLGLRDLSNEDSELARYLIDSLDDDGFLRRELINIVDDLAFNLNIYTTEEKLEQLLNIIQDFDPAGVGARSLQECLSIQLSRKEKTKETTLAKNIVDNYFDAFIKKHYDKILKKLNISKEELRNAINVITKLNPKPGSSYSDPAEKTTEHITPDFILHIENGIPTVNLNYGNIPELTVSKTYAEMLTDYSKNKKNISKDQKQTIEFIKQKLDSARWFIDAVKQRQNTLLKTINAIIEHQKDFFITGDETQLKPMILKDIADRTGLDISTISRVANSKYIQTDFGTFLLKDFFSESMQTVDGDEVSSKEIKAVIKEIINNEDKQKPLSDDNLTKELHKRGYKIARRTLTKYREQLGIPVSRLRKEI